MDKTRSKSKAYFTSVNVMAAIFSLLLLLGAVLQSFLGRLGGAGYQSERHG